LGPLALRACAPYGGRAGRFDSPVADLDEPSVARLPLLGADGYIKEYAISRVTGAG